jgi:hypothetical protein
MRVESPKDAVFVVAFSQPPGNPEVQVDQRHRLSYKRHLQINVPTYHLNDSAAIILETIHGTDAKRMEVVGSIDAF